MTIKPDDGPADERRPPDDESQKSGRRGLTARYAIAVLATVVIMAVLVHRFGAGLADAMRGAKVGWVTAAFVLSAVALLLGALRWQIVLEAMHYRLGFRRSLVAVLATWPLALVTPSRANDFLRAFVVRRTVPLAAGTGSILAEKAVDMSWLLALGVAGAALESLWLWCAVIASALAVELAIVAALVTHRSKLVKLPLFRNHGQKIEELFVAFDALLASPARLVSACTVSLLIRALTLAITFALLRAVEADVDLFDTCALWPVATLVGLVPVTLAGMGTRDAAFMYLLSERGHLVTRANVLAATMGYSAISLGAFAIIGLPFMVRESVLGDGVAARAS
jgi:uncharacterized protein (TIRG00374 family)